MGCINVTLFSIIRLGGRGIKNIQIIMLWAIIKSILEIREQNKNGGAAYNFTLIKKNLKCPFCNSKVYDN